MQLCSFFPSLSTSFSSTFYQHHVVIHAVYFAINWYHQKPWIHIPLSFLFFLCIKQTLPLFCNQRVRPCWVDSAQHDPSSMSWSGSRIHFSQLRGVRRSGGGRGGWCSKPPCLTPPSHLASQLDTGSCICPWAIIERVRATACNRRGGRDPGRAQSYKSSFPRQRHAGSGRQDGGRRPRGSGGPLWTKLIRFPHNLLPAAKSTLACCAETPNTGAGGCSPRGVRCSSAPHPPWDINPFSLTFLSQGRSAVIPHTTATQITSSHYCGAYWFAVWKY